MTNIRFVLEILSLGCLTVFLNTCGHGGSSSSSVPVSSIALSAVIPVGANQHFTASGEYSDGTIQTPQVTWTSSNPSVVMVTTSGRATALGTGTVTITATSGSISGSTLLTVNSATLSSITITPANATPLPVGVEQQFVAIGTYSDGTSHDITTEVIWSSSNPSVAMVSLNSGLATGLAAGGPITITAASGGVSGFASLTVSNAALTGIAVTPANLGVPVGVAEQLKATGTYSDTTTHDISTLVTWSSSSTSVATVGINTGLAIALTVGATTITATLGTISSVPMTLTVASTSLFSIFIALGIHPGTIQQITATGTYSDGTSHDITTLVTWLSPNPSVATITSSGLTTALATGITTIIATLGNISSVPITLMVQ